ncbi:hypothetical protein Tco_0509054 [Tanacetum coccineum]
MASESSSQSQQPKQLTPASNVHFEVEDGIINFNNGIALLESKNVSYHPLLQFLKNSCISVALTKQPSVYYSKYLREFWYKAEADTTTKSITFTLSNFNKPLSFDLDVFQLSLAISFKPTLENEVPLTAHMCKVAKLSPDPIKSFLPPSREVNADDSTDKSLSGISVQPVTQPKAPTDKRLKNKKIPSSSHPMTLKVIRDSSPPTQASDSQPAEEPMVTADIPRIIDDYDQKVKDAQAKPEIPFDTKSKISFVKSYRVATISEEEADSNLHSIPDDEVQSISRFETTDSHKEGNDETDTKNTLSQSIETITDKSSDPLGSLMIEVSSLTSRVANLESTIASKVVLQLEESVPRMVSDAFEERMPELLSDTLRFILPNVIEETLQQALPKFDQRIQETMWANQSRRGVGDLMKDMVFLLVSAKVFEKAKAEGKKVSLEEDMELEIVDKAQAVEEAKATAEEAIAKP